MILLITRNLHWSTFLKGLKNSEIYFIYKINKNTYFYNLIKDIGHRKTIVRNTLLLTTLAVQYAIDKNAILKKCVYRVLFLKSL